MKRIKSKNVYTIFKKAIPLKITPVTQSKAQTYLNKAIKARTAENFFSLYDSSNLQAHPAYCGVTAMKNMLNAMNIDPKQKWHTFTAK